MLMYPEQLDVCAVDFYKERGRVVIRLVCEDGSAYEMNLSAARGLAIGSAIAEGSADLLSVAV